MDIADIDVDMRMQAEAEAWLKQQRLTIENVWASRSAPTVFIIRVRGLKEDIQALLDMPSQPTWMKSIDTPGITLSSS